MKHAVHQTSPVLNSYITYPDMFYSISCRLALVIFVSVLCILYFIRVYRLSIGLRSGQWQDQSNLLTFFFIKALTIIERWQGTPSCLNVSQSWTGRLSSSLSVRISKYLGPFIVVPVGKKNPLKEYTPHLNHETGMIFHRCLSIVVILSCAIKPFRWTNCWTVYSSQKRNCSNFASAKAIHLAFMASVKRGFLGGLQAFNLESWTRSLLTVERWTSLPW